MATTRGGATSACHTHAAESDQVGAIWTSHGLWRRIGKQRTKKHGQRRGEVETLKSVWGWRVCDCCGETLVLGEAMLSVPTGDGTKQVCPGCADTWSTDSPRQKIASADTTRPSLQAGPGLDAHGCAAHAA
jgi:hypothetical protein